MNWRRLLCRLVGCRLRARPAWAEPMYRCRMTFCVRCETLTVVPLFYGPADVTVQFDRDERGRIVGVPYVSARPRVRGSEG